ncbi:hypothetical protein CEXT_553451 [Caerostris extrusa]|uniref:Uncharacterized protein n=1 Tax=Caerostris extrusa TaxID=172846 RepID=A0AAV4MAI6_CAEEX|nr:hypothetical protein CEXT_553451 [Caerostris extrusa]
MESHCPNLLALDSFYEMREEGWILKCDWMEEWTTDAIAERELRYRLCFQMGKPNTNKSLKLTARIPDSYTSVIPADRKPPDLHQRPIQITNLWSTGAKQEFRHKSRLEHPSNPEHFRAALFHFGHGIPQRLLSGLGNMESQMSEFIGVGQFYEMSGEGWILKCDRIEEWTTDVIVEKESFGTGFCCKRVNHTSSVNSRLRIIAGDILSLCSRVLEVNI